MLKEWIQGGGGQFAMIFIFLGVGWGCYLWIKCNNCYCPKITRIPCVCHSSGKWKYVKNLWFNLIQFIWMNLPLQTFLMSSNILILQAHYIQGRNNLPYPTLRKGRTWCLTLLTWRVGGLRAWPFRINIMVQIISKTCKLSRAEYTQWILGPQQILETKMLHHTFLKQNLNSFPHTTHKVIYQPMHISLFLFVTLIFLLGQKWWCLIWFQINK